MNTRWEDSSSQLDLIEVEKADGAKKITKHMPTLSSLTSNRTCCDVSTCSFVSQAVQLILLNKRIIMKKT